MTEDHELIKGEGTETSLWLGLFFSLVLTMTSYLLVVNNVFVWEATVWIIVGLGICQVAVQLLFFLHLGQEARPRYNLIVFTCMAICVVVVVIGTLWVIYNLDDRVMPKMEMIKK